MAPRKSLPASLATPATGSSRKRNAPHTTPPRPNKRQRRVQDEPTAEPDVPTTPPDAEITVDSADVPKPDAEMTEADMEAELEAWQDFAADHYEMVEQLPLELHRNFRLLRELDDGCSSQSTLLLAKMRDYLAYRLGPKRAVFSKAAEATEDAGEPAADAEEAIAEGQEGHAEVNDTDVVNSEPPPKPVVPETVNGPEDMGMPVPDGQGGVLLPAADEPEEPVEERLSFPDAPAEANGGPEGTSISVPREANAEAGPSTVNETGLSREEQPVYIDVLPEIGKLSREIVRNAEEKLAIAVGAYNTIDRHIRALDSALSSQEASILLGLRPDTAPSAAVDTSLNLPGDQAVIGQDANGETTLGLGGGGGRKRGKKSKKKAEVEPVTVVPEAGITIPVDIEADPTEPRYCFCNQVSYGEMVGCDNDDCPREWFHLACVGLEAPPSGRWYCSDCKPKTGLGMGGAGTGGGAARRKSAGGRKKR